MSVISDIKAYISSVPGQKSEELETLHAKIKAINPKAKLWYLDGKNEAGKVVSNPNIGYGSRMIKYADGTSREFYQVGLSANTSGISVYVMGIEDKNYLPSKYGKKIGKATVTGYCIKFKQIKDIDLGVLEDAVREGFGK